MIESLAGWAVRYRNVGLTVAAALAAVVLFAAPFLPFDRAIENMFPPGDPVLPPYQLLKDRFGGNEVVLIVYHDEALFAADRSGLDRLERVTAAVDAVPGVGGVMSLSRLEQQMQATFGTSLLDPDSEQARRVKTLFAGFTHGEDDQTAAIVAMLDRTALQAAAATPSGGAPVDREADPRRRVIADVRAAIADLPGAPDVMLAGEPVMVAEGFRYIEQDGQRLGWISSILLAGVIAVCFRSIRWVLIPLVVVQWALLMTRATLALADLRLSMVSTMLTAIVTVVGVAAVMHVIVAYRQRLTRLAEGDVDSKSGTFESLRRTLPPDAHVAPADGVAGSAILAALTAACVILAAPLVWSCLTDALGFASLLASDVGPVRDFGLMMAVGSLWVLPAVALIVPGLALLPDVEGWLATRIRRVLPAVLAWPLTFFLHAVPQHVFREDSLRRGLIGTLPVVRRLRWPIVVATVAAGAGLAWLMQGQRVETDFTKNFRDQSELARSYAFVEQHLGGAGVWDVVLPIPESLDAAYLQRVREIERRLAAEVTYQAPDGQTRPGLTKVISLVDGLDAVSPVDLTKTPRLLGNAPIRVAITKMREAMPEFTAALYVPPGQEAESLDERAADAEADPADETPDEDASTDEDAPESETATTGNTAGDTAVGDTAAADAPVGEAAPVGDAAAAVPPTGGGTPTRLADVYHPPGGSYRVMLRSLERLEAATKKSIIDQVQRIVDEEVDRLWTDSVRRDVATKLHRMSARSDRQTLVEAVDAVVKGRAVADADGLLDRFHANLDAPAAPTPPPGGETDGPPSDPGPAATDPRAAVYAAFRDAVDEGTATPPERRGYVTGFYILLTWLIESLLKDQLKTFLVAGVGIFLAMWAAVRDIRLAFAALVPNVLPIVAVIGGTAAFGWKVNLGAVMIAAVSIGLSIDSSVQYLMSFRRGRGRGESVMAALAEAQQGAGRSILFATFALVAGFASLSTSNFMPTAYFGFLTALTMLGGMIGNLVILPTLVMILIPDRRRPAGDGDALEAAA